MTAGPFFFVFSPLAVHFFDGQLATPWWVGGTAAAAVLAFLGARRLRDEEIPRVALLTAAFFVASLPHIPVGPISVHLLLAGLMGIVLGARVMLAMPIALFLQAVLGHGGFLAIGINSCVMGLPALLAWWLFALLRRLPWAHRPWFCSGLVGFSTLTWVLSLAYSLTLLLTNTGTSGQSLDYDWASHVTWHPLTVAAALGLTVVVVWGERRLGNAPEFSLGLLVGELAVLATVFLHYLIWIWGAGKDWQTVGLAVFVAHLPIAVLEGIVLGFTVAFLVKVKPELLGWEANATSPPASGNERLVPVAAFTTSASPMEKLECRTDSRP
jgi:cobalt/nickel transport system permease protein